MQCCELSYTTGQGYLLPRRWPSTCLKPAGTSSLDSPAASAQILMCAVTLCLRCEWCKRAFTVRWLTSPLQDLSCKPSQDLDDRGAMLAEVRQKGFVENYSGWRRSLKGSRFRLIDVLLFNVISPGTEDVLGQVGITK